MMDEINELIERTNLVLKPKSNYIRPKRKHIFFDFLSNNDDNDKELDHYYNTVPNQPDFTKLNIIHGHEKHVLCATPHFCHELGYWPDATCNPSFVMMFNQKWKAVYPSRDYWKKEYAVKLYHEPPAPFWWPQ